MAVNKVMDWYHIPDDDRPDVWAKVQTITDKVIQECLEEAERKAKEKKLHGKANY